MNNFINYRVALAMFLCAIVSILGLWMFWHKIEAIANYDARLLWQNIRWLIIGCCCMPSLTIAWITLGCQNQPKVFCNHTSPHRVVKVQTYLPIIFTSLVLYVALSLLLYTGWMQNDEFGTVYTGESFSSRIVAVCGGYLASVSRVGEIILRLFPISPNRWQCYILTPIAVTLIPFFVIKMFGLSNVFWSTKKGVAFYIFAFFLFLLSVDVIGYWRNYREHAAVMNYLWPSCFTFLFLSLYNPKNWKEAFNNPSILSLKNICCFLLGLYCAWGTESGTIALIIILFSVFILYFYKKVQIPLMCWFGSAGAMWGSLLLFASPSFKIRSIFAESSFAKWHLVSSEELSNIVHNLSWDKIIEMNGGDIHSIIILKSIPYFERLHFVPFLLERFWKCCQFPAITAGIIICFYAFFIKNKEKKQHLIFSLSLLLFSILIACSFLAGCIPSNMSFLPPAYIVAVAACYVYIKLPVKSSIKIVISLALSCVALSIFVPAGIEAWKYKKYEYEYISEIKRQKEQGILDVVVPYKLPDNLNNPLKLISERGTGDDAEGRVSARKIHGVNSIKFASKPYCFSTSEKTDSTEMRTKE